MRCCAVLAVLLPLVAVAGSGEPLLIAEYWRRWGGLSLRQGDQLVDAPAEDAAVARGYPTWRDKGPLSGGRRITVMARKERYAVGEPVRVLHVADVAAAGRRVYIMGPKAIEGELVDGKLRTPLSSWPDPLVPLEYDGVTLPSPAIDVNYDITTYTFTTPGSHEIVWSPDGKLRSNALRIVVEPAPGSDGVGGKGR